MSGGLFGMRVGIIQSAYIPWRGYFDFIASVDLFVVYDDVQYSTGSWRNRNRVKTSQGLRWITVPVRPSTNLAVDEVPIGAGSRPWTELHRRLLAESFREAAYADDAIQLWESGTAGSPTLLSPLNVSLIMIICQYLGITTPIVTSRLYSPVGSRTERLIDLLKKVGATSYLSGPAAKAYLDIELFRRAGIGLQFKSYDYVEYPQSFGAFQGNVTVLDMIAQIGPASGQCLRSRTPDELVLPAH